MNAASPSDSTRGAQSYRKGPPAPRQEERRHRVITRAAPIALLATIGFVLGAIVGGSGDTAPAAQAFADAWERQDFPAMYEELDAASRAEYSVEEFTDRYVEAQTIATATAVTTGEAEDADVEGAAAGATFEATVATGVFGAVPGRLVLPITEEGQIDWSPSLVFPGLEPGEELDREMSIGERAAILARDRTPLAEGPAAARSSPLGPSALAIAGSVGSPSRKQARELRALGYPDDMASGTSGLELAFNTRLAGKPGGTLVAVAEGQDVADGRVLTSAEGEEGKPVRTTIDPEVQEAAVAALGSTYGGVAVLDAREGEVLGVAGLAFSAPQPPGSTFKVVTATAALDTGAVSLDDEFPVESSNALIGREISNAGDAACGGNFTEAFAQSCNTVFAPLGLEVGANELFKKAELFGFNEPPTLAAPGALQALAPPASTYPKPEGEVELGESAIGQGRVLATPLQMASVAQAIANGGLRSPTSIVRTPALRPDADAIEVTSPETAATMTELMQEVVESGTGTAAQVDGVDVAGKTGTAELGPAPLAEGQELGAGESAPQLENAWFTAFAPADDPRLAVAVMVIEAVGGGGAVAAPIAQQVFAAELD